MTRREEKTSLDLSLLLASLIALTVLALSLLASNTSR